MKATNRKQFFRAVPASPAEDSFAYYNGYTLEWRAEDFKKAKYDVIDDGDELL